MERINIHEFSFRKLFMASPKFILLLLALLNLLAVPARYAHFCFHNWSGEFYNAFLILIAAACLRLDKRCGYAVAILACCSSLYDFCRTALLFFGFLPLPANTDALEPTPEIWWSVVQYRPEEFMHAGLATVVLIVAAYYLLASVKEKRKVFK